MKQFYYRSLPMILIFFSSGCTSPASDLCQTIISQKEQERKNFDFSCKTDEDCLYLPYACDCQSKNSDTEKWKALNRHGIEKGCLPQVECMNYDCFCQNKQCQKKAAKAPERQCASKGHFVNPPEMRGENDFPDKCCDGLKSSLLYDFDENGKCVVLDGTPYLTCIPCGDGVCDSNLENKCNCLEDCEPHIFEKSSECSEKGEAAYELQDIYAQGESGKSPISKCCDGLRPVESFDIKNGECQPLLGPGAYCVACGDGICEEKWENHCNCSEDCKI